MKNNETLCDSCMMYVSCKDRSRSFCLARDLFTHTETLVGECCIDYAQGEPMTEEEFDGFNYSEIAD